jgi:hypothetical protein
VKKYLAFAFTLVLFVSGCASSLTSDIEIESDIDPKINFSGYETYTWLGSAAILYDPDGRWEPPDFDADAEIVFLIDRELRARGLTEDSVNPDFVVVYAAGINMEMMKSEVDEESHETYLENVPTGALSLMFIDTETRQIFWAARAVGDVQNDPDRETTKKRLDYAVSQMISKLP